MNKFRRKKLISYLFLILYVYFLFKVLILNEKTAAGGADFAVFHIYEQYRWGHLDNFALYDVIFKILIMIPFGILFPLAKQKKGLSYTLTGGIILGCVFEVLQYVYQKGITCFDDILFATLGTYIGYQLFLWLCRKSSNSTYYLYAFDRAKNRSWKTTLVLILIFFCIISIDKNGMPTMNLNTDIGNPTDLSNWEAQYSETIYDKLYTELAAHKTSVTFFGTLVDGDMLEKQFKKVLADHPELFWLTGAGQGRMTTLNGMTTYRFYPEIAGEADEIIAMEMKLNYYVNEMVSAANQLGSDYEKALFVHDQIVSDCEYDLNTYFSSSLAMTDGAQPAYTAYGCLVNHKAVCAGYAKAYQLVMNQLGIECGFVTGTATDDTGSDGHAWNYIKLDGEYYFVDVTWDDPVGGSGMSDICRDYFCITTNELLKDHQIDEGQDVPLCTVIRN